MIALASPFGTGRYQPPSSERRAALLALIAGLVSRRDEATLRERLGGIPAADFGGDEEARWLCAHLYWKTLNAASAQRRYQYLTGALSLDEWGAYIRAARNENRNDEHRAAMRDEYTTNKDRGL